MSKEIIIKKEEELRLAMLNSDVDQLDALVDDSLIFTLPTGIIASKEMDLAAHRSGIQKLSKLELLEQKISLHQGFAVVAAKVKLEGSFEDNSIDGIYCYTRVWAKNDTTWTIVGGQVGVIV